MSTPPTATLTKSDLLELVARDQGMTVDAMLDHFHLDSVVPGICPGCRAITDSCEPDATENWCAECEGRGVTSILVLAEIC